MGRSSHILIAGPGKSGGSLLMYIFTELGINTGFPKGKFADDCGGHYEKNLRGSHTIKRPFPYVLKEPAMCADIDLRIEALQLNVDHIYIMLRRPGPMAAALEFMRRGSKDRENFERTMDHEGLDKLTDGFTTRIIQLVHLVAELDIPHTLVSYPRYASDHRYAYNKLRFIMEKHGISLEQYTKVAEKCIDKAQVKHAYDVMPEWCRARMRETYAFKKRPIGPSYDPTRSDTLEENK